MLAAGGNRLTLGDLPVLAEGRVLTVTGGGGTDVIDTSGYRGAVAVEAGNDSIRVGAGETVIGFTTADFGSGDTVLGAASYSDPEYRWINPTTVLAFTTAGTVAAASFAHVSSIDEIRLTDGTNRLTLTDGVVAINRYGADPDGSYITLMVTGGAGNDTIDASAVTMHVFEDGVTKELTFVARGGDDVLIGGQAYDTFVFDAVELSARDRVTGQVGDTLILRGGGAADLSGVNGVSNIVLEQGTSIVVPESRFGVSVTGSAGHDVVDGRATASGVLSFTGGAGISTVYGTARGDVFRFAPANLDAQDTVDGGAGVDTLEFTAGGVASVPTVTGIEHIRLGGETGQTNTLVFAAAPESTLTTFSSGRGNDTIDVSASTDPRRGYTFVSLDDPARAPSADTFIGGAGADRFAFTGLQSLTAEDRIVGGDGAAVDTLRLSGQSVLTNVRGVEELVVTGTGKLTLGDAMVASASGQHLVVRGNLTDYPELGISVDGGLVIDPSARLDLRGTDGGDWLRGGRARTCSTATARPVIDWTRWAAARARTGSCSPRSCAAPGARRASWTFRKARATGWASRRAASSSTERSTPGRPTRTAPPTSRTSISSTIPRAS